MEPYNLHIKGVFPTLDVYYINNKTYPAQEVDVWYPAFYRQFSKRGDVKN